jgi:hypothetical protein
MHKFYRYHFPVPIFGLLQGPSYHFCFFAGPSCNLYLWLLELMVSKPYSGGNPLWLIGAYAPAGLKLFLKMSKNS